MRQALLASLCCTALAASITAQTPQGGGQAPASVSAEVNGFYTRIAGFITRSAEMVPEDKYTWAPTPEVRSFARLFAHITDDNNGACWQSAGLTSAPPRTDVQDGQNWAANSKSKADLQKALADSVALCEKAFGMVNQANMMEQPTGRGRTRIGSLIYNTSHINEHYGNLVTYIRLQGMVPPSSQPSGRGRGGE
jgi:hypothetical protein